MAASAAKYGHCDSRPPVVYATRAPFRPEVPPPLDFALRAEELLGLDRELDRALVDADGLEALLADAVASLPGPGGLFLVDGPTGGRSTRSPRPGPSPLGGLGPRRRTFARNLLRFALNHDRFRPPWSEGLIQEVHAALFQELPLPSVPGELRGARHVERTAGGLDRFVACSPDRISSDLRAVLDWVDRYGGGMHPLVPVGVLLHAFHSVRPFPYGNVIVGRTLATLYLRGHGLANIGLVPFSDALSQQPELMERLQLWSESSGSYSELVDFLMDRTLSAYHAGHARWFGGGAGSLDEVALRILARARRTPDWFSGREAVQWVGGRGETTVFRHLTLLVERGLLESLGRTRGKRFRAVPVRAALVQLAQRRGLVDPIPDDATSNLPPPGARPIPDRKGSYPPGTVRRE